METVTIPRIDSSGDVVGAWTMPRAPFEEMQLSTDALAMYRATPQDAVYGVAARDLVVFDCGVRKIERESIYLVEADGALRLRSCRCDVETGAVVLSAAESPQTIPAPQLARVRVLGRAVYRIGEL
jgi:hypothetical protein